MVTRVEILQRNLEEKDRRAAAALADRAAARARLAQHNNRRLLKIAGAVVQAAETNPVLQQLIAGVDLEILAEAEKLAKAKEARKATTPPTPTVETTEAPSSEGARSETGE